jgi:uncharacterized membrane protein
MENPALSSDSERLLVLLSYGLMLIAPPMGGFTALIGVVIAHVRLGHVPGSIHESHYRNLIRVFWTMLIYALVMLTLFSFAAGYSLLWSFFWPWFWPWHALMLAGSWVMLAWLGGLLSLALVIWYYWRLILGFVRALDDRPY